MVHKNFDEMCWIDPNSSKLVDLEYRLRYNGLLTPNDYVLAASIIQNYKALILTKTQKQRNYICEKLKNDP